MWFGWFGGKGERTGETGVVAVDSALAVEVLLSLLGNLVDVGVLVFGGHGGVCIVCLIKFVELGGLEVCIGEKLEIWVSKKLSVCV
jgi:hypothetical protein